MIELSTIYHENAIETLRRMPEEFVDMTVTSPPYDDLRDYNGYHFPVEDDATAADAIFICERANIEDALAAANLPANNPIQRTSIDELLASLRHHPRRVDMLGLLPPALFFFQFLLNPLFEVSD